MNDSIDPIKFGEMLARLNRLEQQFNVEFVENEEKNRFKDSQFYDMMNELTSEFRGIKNDIKWLKDNIETINGNIVLINRIVWAGKWIIAAIGAMLGIFIPLNWPAIKKLFILLLQTN